MATISKILARSVYDSRGNPTVEVEVTTVDGTFRSIVPSGASTGVHEAVELRDKDNSKWQGKGVLKAVANVNDVIGPKLIKANLEVTDQAEIDEFMKKLDGTPNKSKLGANAILGVSLAVSRAAAAHKKIPLYQYISQLADTPAPFVLPVPFFNVLNGGTHAGGSLALQEFMIAPIGAESFSEGLRIGSEVYHILKSLAKEKYGSSAGNVGDEGGIAPDLSTAEEALDLIVEAIHKGGYEGIVGIALDPASSEFFTDGKYDLDFKVEGSRHDHQLNGEGMADFYKKLLAKYPIVSLEDPFSEDDWDSWINFLPSAKIPIVGDDLLVTNPERIKTAIEKKAANSLLLKVNQIGSLSEALEACKLAYSNGWGVMVSHRSGETEDSFVADLTVGIRAGQLKSGAPQRSERLAKYNQLLRIEEQLGDKAIYAGRKFGKSVHI